MPQFIKTKFNIITAKMQIYDINNIGLPNKSFLFSLLLGDSNAYATYLEVFNLNTALSLVAKEELPLLIKEVESVLVGEKEKVLFPLDIQFLGEIGSSGMVTKEITRGAGSEWDPESIPTKDFLDILKIYLSQIKKFEEQQLGHF
jgi:hypothetical protein